MTDKELEEIGDKIVGVLKTIYDPEIPVDIYELGLIMMFLYPKTTMQKY